MVSISGALMSKKEVLEPFLALILRDDLLSWHVSKAPVNRTEEQQKAVGAVMLNTDIDSLVMFDVDSAIKVDVDRAIKVDVDCATMLMSIVQ